ncbi:hypothetical protein BGZ63DRAFT_418651 [Mariannaea sp. PMI_226]|nr:hypothetical protein BGZ63DRAFT_418651 [Mariannaea sp. PMI_226]
MADSALSPEDAAAKRASEQARLRKERREAKIKAGGSARLNKITGLGGREPVPEPAPAATTTATDTSTAAPNPTTTAAPSSSQHADPDEVDISDHYYEPKKAAARSTPSAPAMTEDDLRQMMLGFERGNTPRQPSPLPNGANPNLDEDPMMKMMSQLMSGAGFPTDGSSPFPGMPAGANPFQPQPGQQQQQQSSTSANIWRLLHALVALGLGLYVVLLTPFAGTKVERERAALPITTSEDPFSTPVEAAAAQNDLEQRKQMFFWAFATAETVLLTTRFFLLKQGPQPTGIAGTVVGFLPQPYKGYVEIVMRYGQIFTTVRGDMLACIFVLGACAWARG